MGNEGQVHKPWQPLEAYILRGSSSVTNDLHKFDENDDGGSIVEVLNEESGALGRLIPIDDILNFTQFNTT